MKRVCFTIGPAFLAVYRAIDCGKGIFSGHRRRCIVRRRLWDAPNPEQVLP